MNLEVAIELLGYGAASNTTAVTFTRSGYKFDAADYDGATYYFEVVAANINTSTAFSPVLYDQTNSTDKASVSVAANTTTLTRFRSTSFTPGSGTIEYRLKLPATTAAAQQLRVYSARILIVQSGATKTELVYPLTGSNSGYSYGDSTSVAAVSKTGGTTYTTDSAFPFWRRDDSVLATVGSNAWKLSGITATGYASATAYIGLHTASGNLVTGAEITRTGATTILYNEATFDSSATNFADATDYELRIKISSSSRYAYCMRAELRVKLTSLTKAQVYKRIGAYQGSTTMAKEYDFQRTLHTSSNWQSGYTVDLDGSGYCNESSNQCSTSQTSGDSGAGTVVASYINWNSSTKVRKRVTGITLTDGYTQICETQATTQSQLHSSVFLVYNLNSLTAVSQTLAPTYNSLQLATKTLAPTFAMLNVKTKTLAPTYEVLISGMRINVAENPGLENASWNDNAYLYSAPTGGTGGDTSARTAGARTGGSGSYYCTFDWTEDGDTGGGLVWMVARGAIGTASGSEGWTAKVWFKPSAWQETDGYLQLVSINAAGTVTKIGTPTTLPDGVAGSWSELTVTGTTSSDCVRVGLLAGTDTFSTSVGHQFQMDDILLEKTSTVNDYFDGVINGGTWSGTSHSSWSYKVGLTAVSKTTTPVYDVLQLGTKTLIPLYDIHTMQSQTLTPVYDIRIEVDKELIPVYQIWNFGTKTLTPTYQIWNYGTKTVTPTYDILNLVRKDLGGGTSIVTDGLVAEYVGKFANGGTSQGINSPSTTTWTDTYGSYDGTLGTFDWDDVDSGWDGDGSAGDPYRLLMKGDGTDNVKIALEVVKNAGTNGFTFEGWFTVPNGTISSPQPVFCQRDTVGGTYQVAYLGFSNSYNNYAYFYYRPSGGTAVSARFPVTFDGARHHIVATFENTTNGMKVYVDGTNSGGTNATPNTPTSLDDNDLSLGGMFNGGTSWTYPYTGALSGARVYDRPLTSGEVSQNYSAGVLASAIDAGSVTYDIRQLATKTSAPVYDIRQLATQTLIPIYDILALGGVAVSQTLIPIYNILQLGTKTLVPSYDIYILTSQTVTPTYAIRQLGTQTLVPLYDVLGMQSKTLTPTYHIFSSAAQTLSINYDIRELVRADLLPTYILNGLIAKDITFTYDILKRGEMSGFQLTSVRIGETDITRDILDIDGPGGVEITSPRITIGGPKQCQ